MPKINPCISLPETAKVKIRQNLEISSVKCLKHAQSLLVQWVVVKWNYTHNDNTNIMTAMAGCRHGMKRRKRGVETDGIFSVGFLLAIFYQALYGH